MMLKDLVNLALGRKEIYKSKKFSVVDNGHFLILYCEGALYSKVPKNGELTGEYWDYFLPLSMLFENPRILLIGLGIGAIPAIIMRRKKASFVAIECEEEILKINKTLNTAQNVETIKGRGEDLIRRYSSQFDILILDAYEGVRIPREFLSREFAKNAYNALRKKGVFSVNITGTSWYSSEFLEFLNYVNEFFDTYYFSTGAFSTNKILVGLKEIKIEELVRLVDKNKEKIGQSYLTKEYMNPKKPFF
ncbi:MAG: hypothetical protein QXL16_02680 [Candidatus Micrarchaeaceae archaeon]